MTIDKSGLENETKGKIKKTEGMSDPSGATQANPHPVSGHRTPREIAKDEAGAIGQPDVDVIAKEVS